MPASSECHAGGNSSLVERVADGMLEEPIGRRPVLELPGTRDLEPIARRAVHPGLEPHRAPAGAEALPARHAARAVHRADDADRPVRTRRDRQRHAPADLDAERRDRHRAARLIRLHRARLQPGLLGHLVRAHVAGHDAEREPHLADDELADVWCAHRRPGDEENRRDEGDRGDVFDRGLTGGGSLVHVWDRAGAGSSPPAKTTASCRRLRRPDRGADVKCAWPVVLGRVWGGRICTSPAPAWLRCTDDRLAPVCPPLAGHSIPGVGTLGTSAGAG